MSRVCLKRRSKICLTRQLGFSYLGFKMRPISNYWTKNGLNYFSSLIRVCLLVQNKIRVCIKRRR